LVPATSDLAASLDRERAVLLSAHVWQLLDGGCLLLAVDGFAADARAFGQIVTDVVLAYRQADSGQPIDLGPKTASLRAWTQELARFLSSPAISQQFDYWQSQTAALDQAQLPLRDPTGTTDLARLTISLDPDLTTRLLVDSPAAYNTTVQDLVLAAVAWASREVFNLQALAVDIEGDGCHPPGHRLDLSRTVGWLAHPYPMIVPTCPVVSSAIVAAKEAIRAVPSNGLGYALLRSLAISDLNGGPHLAVRIDPGAAAANLGPGLVLIDWLPGQVVDPVAPSTAPVQLTASIPANHLDLTLTFPPDRLNEADAWRLMVALRDGLISIIEHCDAQSTPLKTASDVGLPELDDATIRCLNVAADPQDYQ